MQRRSILVLTIACSSACANVALDSDVAQRGDLADFVVSTGPDAGDLATSYVEYDLARSDGGAVFSTCDLHKVRINELSTGTTKGATDEFIELYNPCAMSVSLQGGAIVYRAATSTSDNFTFASLTTQTIAAHGYFVIANTAFSGTADIKPFASGGGLAAGGGGIAWKDGTGAVIDSVGYGTATNAFIETTVAPAPSTSESLARMPDGHDTNDNATDFQLTSTPTPGAAN